MTPPLKVDEIGLTSAKLVRLEREALGGPAAAASRRDGRQDPAARLPDLPSFRTTALAGHPDQQPARPHGHDQLTRGAHDLTVQFP